MMERLPEISTLTTLTLERIKVAAMQGVSAHTLHSLELESWQEPMLNQMLFKLRAEVLAERIAGSEDVSVPVKHDTIHETVERGLWSWMTAGALLAVCVVAVFSPVAAVGCAVLLAVVALVADYTGSLHTTRRQTYRGTVTISRQLWRKFPEATMVYPKELGRPIQFSTMDPATTYWQEP